MYNGLPTENKKIELVPKMAVALHVLENVFSICQGTATHIPEDVSPEIFTRTILYVDSLDEQKETFKSVSVHIYS